MSTDIPHLVFVSYAEEDSSLAREIVAGLEDAGYRAWYYERDSRPGTLYLIEVGDAIERSQAVILLASPASLKSHQVTNEIVRAYECAKPFLPVLYNLTHAELQSQQPLWRQALGATTASEYLQGDPQNAIKQILSGLSAIGIPRQTNADQTAVAEQAGQLKKVLAVLPFDNLGSPEDEYLANGISDEIRLKLAALSGLNVISRTSSMNCKETDASIRTIGKRLGAHYVLEGTVRRDKSRDRSSIRISADLIDVTRDSHLWAHSYDAIPSGALSIQSEIAKRVADALNIKLLESELGTLTIGSRVGSYRIVRRLGEGRMGIAYEAIDERLDRTVALKVISDKFARDPDYRTRLFQEATNAAKINTEHAVKIWECSEFEGTPFISYEYISGRGLNEVMLELTFAEKVKIARDLAEGLQIAHSLGVIHHDLKPGNVIITDSGSIKILDFGLAKVVSADTVDSQGNIEGTLYYMSPEQVAGIEQSLSTDIFSYGAILYELFTGHKPFDGENSAAVIYAILHEDPTPPCEQETTLPDWVDPLVLRLLSRNAADRFPNMGEVIDYLDAIEKTDAATTAVNAYKARRRTVTVTHLRNLSGDPSWDYFCAGFTEDLIREISLRADAVVSVEPASSAQREIRDIFRRCRSDYVITGTLMRWQEEIKLGLSVYGENGNKLIYGEQFRGEVRQLFELLSHAARNASKELAKASGVAFVDVDRLMNTDVTAYDFYLKGRDYYHTSKPKELELAITMFAKALELDPGFALAKTGLSDVHAFQYNAYYDRRQEKITLAVEEARQALAIDPLLAEAHRALGRCYMFMGDLRNAEKSLRESVDISPKFAMGYRALAWLKDMAGDDEEALIWAKKALELAPTDLETLLLLGMLYLDLRKFTLAMATLQRAVELGPDYGRAYYNLGVVYLKLGVPELAMENFQLAIKYEGDPNSHVDAGYAQLILGDYQAAKSLFLESIERGYLPFIAHHLLGIIDILEGHLEQAAVNFEKACTITEDYLSRDPANCHVASYRALALAAVGRKAEALAILTKLAANPECQGDLLHNMARCYALLGDKPQAEIFKAKSLEHHAGPSLKELESDPHFRVTPLTAKSN
jgi:serine/threonine protein kinase/tetratricopeptide (TPR) repeat protein